MTIYHNLSQLYHDIAQPLRIRDSCLNSFEKYLHDINKQKPENAQNIKKRAFWKNCMFISTGNNEDVFLMIHEEAKPIYCTVIKQITLNNIALEQRLIS